MVVVAIVVLMEGIDDTDNCLLNFDDNDSDWIVATDGNVVAFVIDVFVCGVVPEVVGENNDDNIRRCIRCDSPRKEDEHMDGDFGAVAPHFIIFSAEKTRRSEERVVVVVEAGFGFNSSVDQTRRIPNKPPTGAGLLR